MDGIRFFRIPQWFSRNLDDAEFPWHRCEIRSELAADLHEIFAATTRAQAMTMSETEAVRWEASHPAVARLLEEGIEDCLACLRFPLAHRARIRTTNGLECLNEEIKRRTRVVRIFPNAAACLRLATALCIEQSEEWVSGRRYLDMRDPLPRIQSEAHARDTGLTAMI